MRYRKCMSICLVIIILLFLLLELSLRAYGFCDALLYVPSDAYEYIPAPNQRRYRFGAHISTNSYSQRSDEPDAAKVKILGLGDSVLFGGTMTDNDSLATTLFGKETGMQMLNISAGSWGVGNNLAYLREQGTFGAQAMVLVCSSHDATDRMSHIPVVGRFPNYPDRQYALAVFELWERYIVQRFDALWAKTRRKARQRLDPDEEVVQKVENATVQPKTPLTYPIDESFDELKDYADSLGIPLYVYLHAEKGEVMRGAYNVMGQSVIAWAEQRKVPLTQGIAAGEKPEMYRDGIHLNEHGQRFLKDVFVSLFR